jgi:hypothetical protein
VVDVGCSHGELRGGEERRRARCEEASFTDHDVIVAVSCRTGPLRAGRPLRGVCTGLGEVGAWGLALLGAYL